MTLNTEQTVRDIAIGNPATVRVFETLGIDYCCGGKRPLQEACELAGVPVDRAVELLAAAQAEPVSTEARNWSSAPFAELIEHILSQHHAYIRQESPRLNLLAEKVIHKHGAGHPELATIRDLFAALSQELDAHLSKEEIVLFPFVLKLAKASATGGELPAACFASVEIPISRMLAEHDDAGALTARLRSLSNNYQAPEEACPSYLGLYRGLEDFERDLHQHIHLENNILFPRAIQMDQAACHSDSAR